MSLDELGATLRQLHEKAAAERYEAEEAEAKAWLDFQATPQHNTTSLQDPGATPDSPPITHYTQYKAPPPEALNVLRSESAKDAEYHSEQQQPTGPPTAQPTRKMNPEKLYI